MAKKLKPGDRIRGYRITKVFGPGMMAISYAAESPSGQEVFFKQYKSPAPTVVWYKPFVAYQRELSGRVRTSRAAHFAVQQVDAFEEVWGGPCYFQAYEFVQNGADLQQKLDEERDEHIKTGSSPTRNPAAWARNVTWAKVLMAAVASLHEAKIVHADLKPANAYLIEDPTISAGYQLKLIDMDFSLLADRRAPWHGFQAYIGTDNYRSPEHLARGAVPGLASDVFTCGLMLYELLAGYHPYWQEEQSDYARLVQAYAAKPPALLGHMPEPASNVEVSGALHRCLSPDPAARPSATELRALLSGRGARASMPGSKGTTAAAAPVRSGIPIRSEALELAANSGRSLRIGVRTELGKALVRQFGPDAEFWDNKQCLVERNAQGQWVVTPFSTVTNETLINGEALRTTRPLSDGDIIAVGREAKGISKMPLTVRGL